MTLKNLLKRKKKDKEKVTSHTAQDIPPEFTIIRSDTNSHEIISPPSFASDSASVSHKDPPVSNKRFSNFRNVSSTSTGSRGLKVDKRLSSLLHLRSTSDESRGSANLPTDLPSIEDDLNVSEDKEAQWEKRATLLAQENKILRQSYSSNGGTITASEQAEGDLYLRMQQPATERQISNSKGDVRVLLADSYDYANFTGLGRYTGSNPAS